MILVAKIIDRKRQETNNNVSVLLLKSKNLGSSSLYYIQITGYAALYFFVQ